MNKNHLLLFLFSYSALFLVLFPGYRHIMDPDATGYFAVAEHLAKGNFNRSVNGIWSPLNSWLVAPFINAGFDGILTAKYLNGFIGLINVLLTFFLVKKTRIQLFPAIIIMVTSIFLMLYFVFSRMFGDVLLLTFLLLYLNVTCSENFGRRYWPITIAALIGGIGFYAKAYTFYFTLIHLPVAIYLAEKHLRDKIIPIQLLKKISAALAVLFFVASFWIIALHNKYGGFVLGQKQVTGTLSAQYNQPRVIIYPPAYPDSYSAFDDVSYFNHTPITPFTSFKLFVVQSKLAIYNFITWFERLNEFSFTCIFILLIGLYFFFFKHKTAANYQNNLLLSFIIIWSAGFFLFHVETRFFWIVPICTIILAGIILTRYLPVSMARYKRIFALVLIGSFSIFPLMGLQKMYGTGKNNFEIAEAFKRNGIRGNILTSYQNDGDIYRSIIINYLAKSRHYGPFVRDYTTEEIITSIKQYNINYFVMYYSTPFQKQLLLSSELVKQSEKVLDEIYPGVIVLAFNEK